PGIDEVLDKALAKDPDDRYQNGAAMAEEFAEVVRASLAVTRPRPAPDPTAVAAKASAVTRLSAPKTGPHAAKPATAPPISTPTPPPAAPPTPAAEKVQPRRNWIPFVIGGIVVLALLIGGSFILSSLGKNATPTPIAQITPEATPTAPEESVPTLTAEPPTEEVVVAIPTNTPAPTEAPTETPAPTATSTETPTEIPVAGPPIIGGADKLAYVRDGDIRVVNLDGTGEIKLTSGGGTKTNLSWSADGQEVFFLNDKCIRALDLEGNATFTACFLNANKLEGYAISSLGDQIAIAMDNELFIVPFDRAQFSGVSTRKGLIEMATCEFYAPMNDHKYKDIRWSSDDQTLAVKISGVGAGATAGLNIDQILVLDISTCDDFTKMLDFMPGVRFNIDQYDKKPFLTSWDWNRVLNLFAMTSFTSRDNFGEIYIYNGERQTGEKFDPFGVICCYRDVRWSPDGTHLLFAYQELAPNAPTQLFIVPFGTGAEPILLPVPPVTALRELPEPALRPAVTP
ncbi:MAG TPA: hypothetical protein PK530_23735, partial [Anaerolineales bacterium]|nr:hypothetical protein [Anaerolineales bacterium]